MCKTAQHILRNVCLSETRSITEPAGALALAGLKRYIVDNELIGAQKKFVAVISGANMNFDRLRFVAERAELGEGREALLSVEIPEKPGRWVAPAPLPRTSSAALRVHLAEPTCVAVQLLCSPRHDSPAGDDGVRLPLPPSGTGADIPILPARDDLARDRGV